MGDRTCCFRLLSLGVKKGDLLNGVNILKGLTVPRKRDCQKSCRFRPLRLGVNEVKFEPRMVFLLAVIIRRKKV